MAKPDKLTAELNIEHERMKYAFTFRMRIADGFFSIGRILSFGVPGYFIWKVFETFGGKATTFSVSFVVKASVVISVASVAAVITAWAKMNQQKKELVRCRERTNELEKLVPKKGNSENKQ